MDEINESTMPAEDAVPTEHAVPAGHATEADNVLAERGPAEMDVFEFLETRVGTVLRGVARLSERLLVMVFHSRPYQDWDPELTVVLDGASNPLLTRSFRFSPPDSETWEGRAVVVHLPEVDAGGTRDLRVQVRSWRRSLTIEPAHIAARLVGIRTLLREELADLAKEERTQLTAMLASSSEWHSTAGGGHRLSTTLHRVRDALREPYPVAVQDRRSPQGLAVDALLAVDERSFWIKGWRRDTEGQASRLLAMSPEGMSFDLLPGLHLHDRPDVRAAYGVRYATPEERTGFLHFFSLPAPSRLEDGWICEMHDRFGGAVEASAPSVAVDPTEVRNRILNELVLGSEDADFLARNHMHPAITRLRELELADAVLDCTLTFGTPHPNPDTTVILPLFRRFDLLEYQFASFVHDPAFREAELLLVLDSPDQRDRLEEMARSLHALYGVPFRVAVTKRNLGLSAACNLAASAAIGRRLVFMHSDVVPRRPGWLNTMSSQYDSIPNAGALGPRLLYEDGTVQSAGLFFRQADDGTGWELAPLLHGLHGDFATARESRKVAAVSSALLMVERERFEEISGFRTDFVHGGYEDADLCLRLQGAGYDNWCSGSAELFHLEGQSFPGNLKSLTSDYNRWLHGRFWGAEMENIAGRFPVRGVAPLDPPKEEVS